MIARNTFRGFVVASSSAAAIIATFGLAGAAFVHPTSATITAAGATITATLDQITTDLPNGTVQCTLLIDGNQNDLSVREHSAANFTLNREVADGVHLAVAYCAEYPEGSDTPASYPTLACAKVTVPAGTVESRAGNACHL